MMNAIKDAPAPADSMPADSMPAGRTGWPHDASPYHRGEQAMQTRAGVRERVERGGRRMIRDFMPEQHRELFEKLPFLIVGSLDAAGRPWASILAGHPGFIAAPDPRRLRISATPLPGDPLRDNLVDGAALGLLGIELETRRRNRVNGRARQVEPQGFAVEVDQSFGNCPQYIQGRHAGLLADGEAKPAAPGPVESALLSPRARALIGAADTFFIATASAQSPGETATEGADVSHRGGRPGFVRIDATAAASVLTVPDFRGNAFFNTLGNLTVNPRAGLLFIDFARGDVLLLTGAAEVIWDGPDLAAFAGAERLLRFTVERGLWIDGAVPFRWSAPEFARELDRTGSW
jgi:predicted pyridoxine 5'-phosphate oxidase superfamily flavin-nucleotide-binding protein